MEGKGLLFLIILAVAAFAVFSYLGVKTYKELQEKPPKTPAEIAEPAGPQSPQPAKPATGPDYFTIGRDAYRQGDYAAAAANLQKAMDANPDNQTARDFASAAEAMLRVQNAQMAKKWDEALAACEQAMRYSLSAPDARRRSVEIAELRSYHENYDKGVQASVKGDYETAARAFREAQRIAARLGLTSDAAKMSGDIQAQAQKGVGAGPDSDYILQACADRSDPYATYAAISYYLSCDSCKPLHPVLKTKLDIARITITSNREKYPSLLNSGVRRFTIIKRRSGEPLKGQIIEKDDLFIKLRQEKDGKTLTRTIPVKEVVEIKEEVITPDAANDKRAEEQLKQAASELEMKHPFKALSLLGVLMLEFADAPLLKDAARQHKVIAESSVGTALQGGVSLQNLLETCVQRGQTVCLKCEGLGKIPCANCKATGKATINCMACNGTGRINCYICAGQGRLPAAMPNTVLRCQVCNGKGTLPCQECQGAKVHLAPCDVCRGARGSPCQDCFSTGQRQKAR